MNRFYRGDLVLWPGEPWARGPWEVIEDGPVVSPITGGQTVTSYLIRPHRGAGDSYRVDAGSLTRYTRIDDAYEVGTRVIWEPQGYRRRALSGMSLAVVTGAQVGTIESAQNNPQWAGDVLLRFPTDRGDWMQFAWRADCRRAPADRVTPTRVTPMTATQVMEMMRAAREPATLSPADEMWIEQIRASSVMPALTRTQREQILGFDVASGPDFTAITMVEPAENLKPVAPPETPTVIGGKRRLKL